MILKKPYVILIKYFKLIHVFLTIFLAYSIYKINVLLRFFNDYLSAQNSVIGQNLRNNLYTNLMFIVPFLVLIISILLLWLMAKKKKPFRFYIYNTLVYLFISIIFIYTYSFLGKMEVKIVDIVIVRALRDVLTIAIILQSISLIITFVRAIGFDIKNFEFLADLQQLQISEEDQEEYEVDFNYDSNERRRKRKRKLRYLKYSYRENKLFINIAIAILIGVICFITYNRMGIYTKINKEGTILSTEFYNLGIENTYLVNTSYKGVRITDNYLVVLNLKVRSKGIQNKLLTGNFKLQIGDSKYLPTKIYDKYLTDLGNGYNDDLITSEYQNFLLIYEIPEDDINKAMKLIYFENKKSVKIKLNPIKEEVENKEYQLGETILINDLDSIVIDNYELKDTYILSYDYCIKDECYNSLQYLVPTLDTNYDKAILKISGKSSHKETSVYNNFNNLLSGIGYIEYVVGNETKVSSLTRITNLKKEESNTYYYEVNKELMNSDSIKLVFNTRKCKYSYVFK